MITEITAVPGYEDCPVECGEKRCVEIGTEISQYGVITLRVVYCPSCEALISIQVENEE